MKRPIKAVSKVKLRDRGCRMDGLLNRMASAHLSCFGQMLHYSKLDLQAYIYIYIKKITSQAQGGKKSN